MKKIVRPLLVAILFSACTKEKVETPKKEKSEYQLEVIFEEGDPLLSNSTNF